VPEDALQSGSGWLLQDADTEAGEWNLARAFGTPDGYLRTLEALPRDRPYHLLIPWAHETMLPETLRVRVKDRLHWYRDDLEIGGAVPELEGECRESIPVNCSLTWREAAEPVKADWRWHAYFLKDQAIATLVRPVRVTPHTVEIYVETLPHLREQGLATKLLQIYRQRLRAAGRCLLYVVSSQNSPSLRVAARLGLTCYQTLLRIPT